MSVAKSQQYIQMSLRVRLSAEEMAQFRRFLSESGRKAGPWIRTVIINAIEEKEKGNNES